MKLRQPVRRLSVLLVLAASLTSCEKPKPPALPPPVVEVLTVQPQKVPVKQTWVATVTADVYADIRAQVSGYLQSQNYANGAYVKAGDLLFQIDPRPFQAKLDQAAGSLAQSQAQLTATELNYRRSADLYAKKVISQEQYDDQTQQYQAAAAATQAAQAAVEQAKLNLIFTRIIAPVDGIASIATAQVGDLVGPSTGTLATVVKVNPIKVQFMIAEPDYVRFITRFFKDPNLSPIGTNKTIDLPLTLQLAGGTAYPLEGHLTSIDNVVGQNTGAVSAEGIFPNPGNLLRPGQFGLVTAIVHEDDGAMVVPQRATIDLQGQPMLAVVGPGNKIEMRMVTLGSTVGSDQIVTKGLNAGDQVVVEGVQKIREGSLVNPRPYVPTQQEEASDPEMTPAPTEASPTPKP